MNNILRIKEIRIAKNLTIDELAKKSGISKRMISAYEANENDITLNKLQNIATALQVGIDELIIKKSILPSYANKHFIELDVVNDVEARMNNNDDVSALKLKIMQLEAKLEVLSTVNEKLINKLGSKAK